MPNIPPKMKKRQITLGAALDGFEVNSTNPSSASADVAAGFLNNITVAQEYVRPAQIAGPFVPVSVINRVRWDLVYLNKTGVVAVAAGAEQIVGVPDFTGAPGNGVAFVATDVFPLAYVKIDESGAVLVTADDITDLRAFVRMGERGVVGELQTDDNTGAGGVIGTLWKHVPVDHRHPPNVDLNPPNPVALAGASSGATNIYARRDHVHVLSAPLAASLATPMARSMTLHWTEYDPSTGAYPDLDHAYHWVLHRFQGRAKNDPSFWFNIEDSAPEKLALWPVDGGGTPLHPNIGLGFADTTDPTKVAMANGWLYVYIIGNPTSLDVALVYSSRAPSLGPDLSNAAFTGYTAWRWITCINISDNTSGPYDYPAVAMRKYDDLVLLVNPAGGAKSTQVHSTTELLYWTVNRGSNPLPLAVWVSPMSMSVLLNFYVFAYCAPAAPTPSGAQINWSNTGYANGVMDTGDYVNEARPKEMMQIAHETSEYSENWMMEWVLLNAARQMWMFVSINNNGEVGLYIVGYIEFNDLEASAIDWSP